MKVAFLVSQEVLTLRTNQRHHHLHPVWQTICFSNSVFLNLTVNIDRIVVFSALQIVAPLSVSTIYCKSVLGNTLHEVSQEKE